MGPRVAFRAQSPVKTTYVTYRVEYVWSVNMGYMVATVINRVQTTVKSTYVSDRMEHVLHVNLDGPGCIVQQVTLLNVHVIKIYMNS